MKRFALVTIGTAVVLTLCDQLFHVRTGTLAYHWHPQVFDQTIVVPATFLIAAILMLDISRRAQRVQPRSTNAGSVVVSLVAVTSAYLVSGFVDQGLAPAYAALLLVTWVVRIVWRGERGPAIAAAATIATGGVLGEAALSAIGEFSYLRPDLLGVPWWLFPLYLHGALAARDIAAVTYSPRMSPPSTGIITPVMKLAAGESKKAATLPNSSGLP